MAATCRDIVNGALRKLGVVRPGSGAKAGEAADALFALQSMYLEWIEGGMFGALSEVVATANAEVGENQRVLAGGYTISFPATVTDALTGDSRSPSDLAIAIVVTAGEEPDTRIYDANRAAWVALDGLELGDDAPLAGRGADGLSACLAKRLGEDYGQAITVQTEQSAGRFAAAISLKRTSRAVEVSYF